MNMVAIAGSCESNGGRSGGNQCKDQQKKKKEYSGKATVNAAPAVVRAAAPAAQPQHAAN
jgi:hypothetical protein